MNEPLTAVSLFAGIGGFDEALRRCGVHVTAAVEIDPDCRSVLGRHFPQTTLFNDVTEVTGDQLRATGFVPEQGIITAGWPCQGNSVAGRRGGMADPRSGLWRHVVRLLAETRPRWFIGENVPGLLSINNGRDFGTVIADLDELGYGVAWRVLDAQWFGVPQRRRRVFIAGCLGDPAGSVEVLLEPESGAGHSAARGAARPDLAGTLGGRAGGSRTTDLDGHGAYVTVGTLGTSGPGGGWRIGADEAAAGQLVTTLQGGGRRGHRVDAEGAAGGHLVVGTARQTNTGPGGHDAGNFQYNRPWSWPPHRVRRRADHLGGEPRHRTRSHRRRRGSQWRSRTDAHPRTPHDRTPLISLAVAGDFSTGENVAQTVRGAHGQPGCVTAGLAVRRLTPTECERLMGLPDGWTSGQSDSARYRQLGNSVAVPVIEWIGHRIIAIQEAKGAAHAA